MDEYYIPKYLDTPKKYLIFSVDEVVAILIIFLVLVFVFKQNILALIACVLTYYGLRKLKGDKPPHFLLHLFYWHLPPFYRFRQIPDSYKKRFLG
jgi:conjugal transfer pilus assembly protein TraL